MSRSESIAVVESYLNGLASKDLSSVPFARDITSEGPLMPKLAGRETLLTHPKVSFTLWDDWLGL